MAKHNVAEQLERTIRGALEEEVAGFPLGGHPDEIATWCYSTAVYLAEIVKRKGCSPAKALARARKAQQQRIEQDIAKLKAAEDRDRLNSWLTMELPKLPEQKQDTKQDAK